MNIIESPVKMELEDFPNDQFGEGDYVTRDGTDVHFVEELSDDLITVVCIVMPSSDWANQGEIERNVKRRYTRINKHLIPLVKKEHEKLKKMFHDGWVE